MRSGAFGSRVWRAPLLLGESDSETETETDRDRDRARARERETDRQTDRQRDRERERIPFRLGESAVVVAREVLPQDPHLINGQTRQTRPYHSSGLEPHLKTRGVLQVRPCTDFTEVCRRRKVRITTSNGGDRSKSNDEIQFGVLKRVVKMKSVMISCLLDFITAIS